MSAGHSRIESRRGHAGVPLSNAADPGDGPPRPEGACPEGGLVNVRADGGGWSLLVTSMACRLLIKLLEREPRRFGRFGVAGVDRLLEGLTGTSYPPLLGKQHPEVER